MPLVLVLVALINSDLKRTKVQSMPVYVLLTGLAKLAENGRGHFKIKSFTGRVWEIPSWRTPNPKAFGSESEQGTSNSQSKENSSSNVGSDKSPAVNPSVVASSPAPALAIPA